MDLIGRSSRANAISYVAIIIIRVQGSNMLPGEAELVSE